MTIEPMPLTVRSADFANLSNGLACAPAGARLCRIQSTWCEQKRWSDLLLTVPTDLYAEAASGAFVIVHDQSERRRATRAQWQGLSWLRHACRAAWGLPEQPEVGRSGHVLTRYWREMWDALPDRTKGHVRYFRELAVGADPQIRPCWCPRVEAHLLVVPSRPLRVRVRPEN